MKLPSFFCHERWEQITYGCSFVKSNWSDSLTVTLFKRATRAYCSFKKSNWGKSDRSNLLLGIKGGKTVKNKQKNMFCLANRSFYESNLLESQANHGRRSLLKKLRALCYCLLFFKERWEWITNSRSLIWAILSKRAKSKWVKSERANSQPCTPSWSYSLA